MLVCELESWRSEFLKCGDQGGDGWGITMSRNHGIGRSVNGGVVSVGIFGRRIGKKNCGRRQFDIVGEIENMAGYTALRRS